MEAGGVALAELYMACVEWGVGVPVGEAMGGIGDRGDVGRVVVCDASSACGSGGVDQLAGIFAIDVGCFVDAVLL